MAAIAERVAGASRPYATTGLMSWLTTVDHKRIGIMYLLSGALFLVFGGAEAFIMRLQLMRPDNHLVTAQFFDQLFTMHGVTMIFLVAMPLLIGYINAIVPLQIGARDVAFPRMNALSFWLFFVGALLLNSSWFLGGAPDAGWFSYAPISLNQFSPGPGIDFYDLGLQLAGIGTLMTAVNFLATIVNMRAPGMSFMRMPLFVWSTFITMVIILFAFPPFTVNLFLLMFDRLLGANFFNVAHGGNVLLWQHLFWIFGHPEVYIVILPAFGMISEIMATFSRKPLFGYESMVFALVVIGFLAFMVWTHHMFAVGMGPWVNSIFAVSSMAIAVPTGVKIFNWIMTMWGGKIRFTAAQLFAAGFIPIFVIGGITGVMLAVAPADFQFEDTYFVVAHFHYVLIGGTLFALLAATCYWFPKITGRLLSEGIAKWSFWWLMVGFNVTFFPMHFMGLLGMPRRVYTYSASLGPGIGFWNFVSTVGVWIMAVGFLLFAYNLVQSLRKGEKAGPDPWEGRTLEWALPSPVPEYNFREIPLIRGRDAWWVEKTEGDGTLVPAKKAAHGSGAHHGIHMPSGSIVPFVLAVSLMIAAYGAIFSSLPVIIVGLVGAVWCIHRSITDEDPGYIVEPAGGDAE